MSDIASAPTYRHAQSPIIGVLWMVAAAAFFAVTFGLVRHLSDSIDVLQQVFLRQVIGALIMLPFVLRHGRAGFKTHMPVITIVRNTIGYVAITFSFLSLTLIPLADSTVLHSTLPFFTMIFAFILLRERPRAHRWIATALGFLGAVVILRPGIIEVSLGMTLALAAAAAFSLSDTLCRKLSQTDSTTSIVFYSLAVAVPLALPLAIVNWTTPSTIDWLWIIAMALASFGAQWCLSMAYGKAEAGLVSPVLFLRLPMVAVIGFIFFDQTTDLWTWIGAAIIFAASYYMARRETVD